MTTLRDTDTLAQAPAKQLGWRLPTRYSDLPPRDQQEILRAAVQQYLRAHGKAARSAIADAIDAPRNETLYKALDYLATTQQIYVDATAGSKDPTYYSNGKLAHDKAQAVVEAGLSQFVIRAWDDRLAGKTLTITQYTLSPTQEPKPVSGIRIDWEDAEELIAGLQSIIESVRSPTTIRPDRK